ncbi:MAG: hypothetical protein EP298_07620 [Gammaproteobacteria bacterium]|nr:MAG: hypothetical protein EP298_07620 [Gammaproteobacteria bacterium]UTW43698.1 pentapeptide repeat-containing protein [bacterium SCSIO 12844]
MKEYIGLRSWLTSKFVEAVLYTKLHRVNQPEPDRTVAIPSLDDTATISSVLVSHNETLGEERIVLDPLSYSGTRRIGIRDGKNWDQYDQFVIPINTSAAHNEALILFPGENPKKAIFVDPMGTEISAKRRLELQELGFTNILSVTHQVQQDGFRCGDYTIALVEAILNELNPELTDQERLNEIARNIPTVQHTLDRNRANYVHEYLLSLTLDGVDPTDREVVVSNSLMREIETAQADNDYRSPFLSEEPDVDVSRHDLDARIRDSLVYRRYFRNNLDKMLEDGVSSDIFSQLEREYKSQMKSDTSGSSDVSSITTTLDSHDDLTLELSDKELRKQKIAKRQENIKELESKIKSLNEQIESLDKIYRKSKIDTSDKKLLKVTNIELTELQDQLKQLAVEKENFKESLDKKAVEIQGKLNIAFEKIIDTKLSGVITKEISAFLNWKGSIDTAIKDDTTGLDDKLGPLFEVANLYLKQQKKLNQAKDILSEKREGLESLKKLGTDKLDMVKRWKILDTVFKKAMLEYEGKLKSSVENDDLEIDVMISRLKSKFGPFSGYGATFGDGEDIDKMNYRGMAEALYNSYQVIMEEESFIRKSRSRKLLLSSLNLVGIEQSDFKSIDYLARKIESIVCDDNPLIQRIEPRWSLKQLNSFSEMYLKDRLREKYQRETIDVAQEQVEIETKALFRIQQKHEDSLKRIVSLVDDKALEENLNAYSKELTELKDVDSKINITDKSAAQIIDRIDNHTKDYITTLIEQQRKVLNESKQALDNEVKEAFKDEISFAKVALDKEIKHYLTQLDKLTKFNDTQLSLSEKVVFNDMIKELKNHHKLLGTLSDKVRYSYEQCERALVSKSLPGEFYDMYSQLQNHLNNVTMEVNQVGKAMSEIVFWLSVNIDKDINLGIDIAQLNFEGNDLRAANLSRVKESTSFSYDYAFAKYTDSTLGVVDHDEIQKRLLKFKNAIDQSDESLNTILQDVKLGKLNHKQYKEHWNLHFPFFPILANDNDAIMTNLISYMEKTAQLLTEKDGQLSTRFPKDMDYSDFSDAKFVGRIQNVSLESAIMPKDLRGIKFKNCPLKGADFGGSRVDEHTKLTISANNLQGLVLDSGMIKRGKNFSLVGSCIDGIEGGSLPRDLRGFDLSHATLSNIDLNNHIIDETTILDFVTFDNVTFNNCDLQKAMFSKCTFENCRFIGQKTKLNEAQFDGCDFVKSIRFKVSMSKTEFSKCSFENCQFENEDDIFSSIKVNATFKSSKFLGNTKVGLFCDLSQSSMESVYINDLSLELGGQLPESGKLIKIKHLKQSLGTDISKSIFSKSDSIEFTNMSSDQFISLLDSQIKFLRLKSKSTNNSVRTGTLNWVRENIGKVGDITEYYKILDRLQDWQKGTGISKTDKLDDKWRVFNHYHEYKRKKVEPSDQGNQILALVKDRISRIQAITVKTRYEQQIPAEYRFFQKAFNELFTNSEVDKLNSKSIYTKLIREIRAGHLAFRGDVLQQYTQAAMEVGGLSEVKMTTKRLNQVVSITKDKGRHKSASKALSYALTVMQPSRIDQTIDSFTPTELLQAATVLGIYNPDLDEKITSSGDLNSLIKEASIASNTLLILLHGAIENTVASLKLKSDRRFFLNLIAESPLSHKIFINKDNIEKYLNGEDRIELFHWGAMAPDQRIDLINEMLLYFDDRYVFHDLKDRESYQRVKEQFLLEFDLGKSKLMSEAKDIIVDGLMRQSPPLKQKEAEAKFERLIKQFEFKTTHPLHVGWPSDTVREFEGKDDYEDLKDTIKEWSRETALAKQIDSFVRKVIDETVKASGALEDIAKKLPNGEVEITISSNPLLTLDDLNNTMKTLHKTRRFTGWVRDSEEAVMRAIEKYVNDPSIFKPISGSGITFVETKGELKDKRSVTFSLVKIKPTNDLNSSLGGDSRPKELPYKVWFGLKKLNKTLNLLKHFDQITKESKKAIELSASGAPELSDLKMDEFRFIMEFVKLTDPLFVDESSTDKAFELPEPLRKLFEGPDVLKSSHKRAMKKLTQHKKQIIRDINNLIKELPDDKFSTKSIGGIKELANSINKSSTYKDVLTVCQKITRTVNEGFGITKSSEPPSPLRDHSTTSNEPTHELV